MEQLASSTGTGALPSDASLPERIGSYRVLGRLATGGTSDVLLAHAEGKTGPERVVVLKLLLEQFRDDRSFERMFAREAAAYARLSHPAIVKLYDFLSDAGQLVLVLEYVDGLPLHKLRALLKKPRFLDDAAAMFLGARVASALGAAHTARDPQSSEFLPVIHRDVNPSNVLIPWDGEVKIADFGIAKVAGIDNDRTQAGFIKGTYGYMAPEQVRGEAVTVRTDVYAVSLLLWELLVGRKAIVRGGASDLDVLRAMAHPAFPSLGALRPDLPRELLDAVACGLERDPARRVITAEQLAQVLGASCNLEEGRQRLVDAIAGVRPAVTSDELAATLSRTPPPAKVADPSADATIPNPALGDAFSIVDILPDKPRTTPPPVVSSRPPSVPAQRPPSVPPPPKAGLKSSATLMGISPSQRSPPPPPVASAPRSLEPVTVRAPPPAEALVARTPAPPPPVPSTTARLAPPALSRTQPLGQSASRTPPPALARTQPLASTVPVAPPKANVIVARTPPPTAFAPVPPQPPPLPTAFSQPPQPFPLAYSPAPAHAAMQAPTPAPAPVAWTPAAAGVHDVHAPTFPVLSPARPSRARIAALATVLGVLAVAMLVVVWFRSRAPTAYVPTSERPVASSVPIATTSTAASTAASTSTSTATATATATATPTPTQAPVTAAVASAAPGPSATAAPPAPPPAVAAVDPIPPTPSAAPAPAGTAGVITVPPSRGGHRVWVDKHFVGESPSSFTVHCGWRAIQVGSQGQVRRLNVPCGGELVVTW